MLSKISKLPRNAKTKHDICITENVGVQGIEPTEIYTQQVIITDCVSIYYGVRYARLIKKGAGTRGSPYSLISLDIAHVASISGHPQDWLQTHNFWDMCAPQIVMGLPDCCPCNAIASPPNLGGEMTALQGREMGWASLRK